MTEKEFEHINCIVCGTKNESPLYTKGQFGLTTNVVICKECGLSYLNPRWTKESLWDFYINDYDQYYRPRMGAKKTNNSLYIPIYNRLSSKKLLSPNIQNILDIGSGEGTNLEYMIEQLNQANFYAIEPSPTCQETLKGMGINILSDDIEKDFDSHYQSFFDLIIMRHVLEHLGNPVDILRKILSMLKDDGVLYIAVPNSLNFGTHPLQEHCFRTVHLYYFNIYTLENVFKKAGAKIHYIYEGDDYNKMELIAMVTKGDYSEPEFTEKYYQIQKKFFEEKLQQEKSLLHRFKKKIRNIFPK